MENVLLVDDEQPFLLSLKDGLISHSSDLNILCATNGKEAVEILSNHQVDMVVTDLKMPQMDGFELLAYLTARHPNIPVIVMTAFGNPEIARWLEQMGAFQFLEKPLDYGMLVDKIFEGLSPSSKGYLKGITLPAFMQLVEMEKKTFTLKIKSADKEGILYFRQGMLINAECGELTGKQAAFEIVTWADAEIEIDNICRKRKKVIDESLSHILMEGLRLKDEAGREVFENQEETIVGESKGSEVPGRNLIEGVNEEVPSEIRAARREETNSEANKQEVKQMAIKDSLDKFREVEGFWAVGVFTAQGEMIDSLVNKKVDINAIGLHANNALLNAQKATEEMGVGRGNFVQIRAPQAQVLLRCLNEATDFASTKAGKAHFHSVVVLDPEGNAAMAKMILDSVVEKIAEELR